MLIRPRARRAATPCRRQSRDWSPPGRSLAESFLDLVGEAAETLGIADTFLASVVNSALHIVDLAMQDFAQAGELLAEVDLKDLGQAGDVAEQGIEEVIE